MAKNVTRIFDKELLLDILAETDFDDAANYEVLEDTLTSTSRWSTHHELVFKELDTGKIYSVSYRQGATEMQEETPWINEGRDIVCTEVEPVTVTTIKFAPVRR